MLCIPQGMNQLRHDLFWNQPPPLGVAGINRRRYIDFDECGFDWEPFKN